MPVTVEPTVSARPLLYTLYAWLLVGMGFSLARYLSHGDTFPLVGFVFFVLSMALLPVLSLRFPTRFATEWRIPLSALRMQRAALFLMWVAMGVLLVIGFQDLLYGLLPWPVHGFQLAALVPLGLAVEAFVRERRWRS
ncbi:hypothetical protein MRI28_08140 [Nocardiopsis dassonvillei]|uniref:hypothetical protein n=1 Tax=Nocardiopsis dassonvillei TaxID=2014 RepID=UPI00200F5136|nr:hypothetical protein [Nocardiopsis dassonvillei]MCK9869624.1 hypothetical protein [Nocardiopsis dassonvillei]